MYSIENGIDAGLIDEVVDPERSNGNGNAQSKRFSNHGASKLYTYQRAAH